MNLYKVTLAYQYAYEKHFSFYVIADNVQSAQDISIATFKSYDYGDCIFVKAELIATEGQYGKPDILIIKEMEK